jgi:methylmalonyl-CoA mutase N-terminal domain/subunit
MGGAVRAIEEGFQKSEIERAAYDLAKRIDSGEQVVVGVNRFQQESEDVQPDLQRIDEAIRQQQIDRIDAVKRDRDQGGVDHALAAVRSAATGRDNLLVPMRDALQRRATLQEVCDVLRDEYGGYVPHDVF